MKILLQQIRLCRHFIYLLLAPITIIYFLHNFTSKTQLDSLKVPPIKAHTPIDLVTLYQPVFPEPTPLKTPSEKQILGTITVIGPPLDEKPINTKGTILIPKIQVNSPIEFDVAIDNKTNYQQALNKGVAHAKGTGKPTTQNSNTYLFAHSTANEQDIAQYAAVFTKLKELELDDQIVIFYQEKRFDYALADKEIVPSFEVSVLTRDPVFPALTLQTCDPPGIPKDRLIVTAKLVAVYEE